MQITMPLQPKLLLKAQSIIASMTAHGTVQMITLFNPDDATRKLVEYLEKGERFDTIELVDVITIGGKDIEDKHYHPKVFEFLKQIDSDNPHSILLIFYIG